MRRSLIKITKFYFAEIRDSYSKYLLIITYLIYLIILSVNFIKNFLINKILPLFVVFKEILQFEVFSI